MINYIYKHKSILIYFLVYVFIITVYLLSSQGQTPFNYFSKLAHAFINGKYWIENPEPWLTELIPFEANRFFVVYPPMPSILLVPFQLVWERFPQQYLAHLLGAGITIIFVKIGQMMKLKRIAILYIMVLIGLGNIIWYMSSVGSVWYLGQITAAFFMSLAILFSLGKRRPFLVGVFLGAMYLSRINTIVSLPFFLYLFWNKNWFKNWFKICLGILPFIIFNFLYNYVRFGTIFDRAYFLLPKVLNEENAPWFINGVANIIYIPNNIRAMFWSFPKIMDVFPYIQPSWAGLAIWITTPAFIYSFFAPLKEKLNIVAWFAILLIFLIVTSHGGTGWSQFGYRFAVDFYPLLFFLVIKGIARGSGPKWHHWILLAISVVVNLWGVLWINKFGWINF